jgi:hypothetical protein
MRAYRSALNPNCNVKEHCTEGVFLQQHGGLSSARGSQEGLPAKGRKPSPKQFAAAANIVGMQATKLSQS